MASVKIIFYGEAIAPYVSANIIQLGFKQRCVYVLNSFFKFV